MNNKYALTALYGLDIKLVKKRLIDLDWTQRDLIARCPDVAPVTVLRYINGAGFNPKIQRDIAHVLGVPLSALLAGDPTQNEDRP